MPGKAGTRLLLSGFASFLRVAPQDMLSNFFFPLSSTKIAALVDFLFLSVRVRAALAFPAAF